MKIIDISYHNGNIDFNKVKKSGIEGVIIRGGYGAHTTDKKFKIYITNAIKANLHIGIYWFSYAYSVDTAEKEAAYCLSVIENYKDHIDLGVWFDWEYDSMSYAAKQGVKAGKTLITDMNLAFCKKIKAAGYKAGFYFNEDYRKNYLDFKKLSGYRTWLARYTTTKQTGVTMWQYSSTGKVEGITGNVDMDLLLTDKPESGSKKESKNYFKKYTGNSSSIVDALITIGAKADYAYRKKIATKNGIKDYDGRPEQNLKMLQLLSKGKLIKP